jgi:CDP-diglyceride synthetase
VKSNTNWQNAGLGLIGIAIFGVLIWALFYQIGQAPWPFVTIVIALLGALITVAGNFSIQIRNEQKPKKIEIYDKVINFFLIVYFPKIRAST